MSFSPFKGDYVGREPLARQFQALKRIMDRDYSLRDDLPRMILPLELADRGIARAGDKVFRGDEHIGYVTSGTMVPYWKSEGVGIDSKLIDETGRRAIGWPSSIAIAAKETRWRWKYAVSKPEPPSFPIF